MKTPTPTRVAAIALCGRHPILLIGGRTNHPAAALAKIMAAALPELRRREQAESEAIWRRAGTVRGWHGAERRPPGIDAEPGDPVLANETEPVGLAELAHHGVLGADDIQAWDERSVAELLVAAVEGRAHRRPPGREPLRCHCRIAASATGCNCANRAQHCECTQADIEAARRRLWAVTAYYLFDVAAAGPERDDEIDAGELRDAFTRARRFALATRDQPQANSLTPPPPSGAEGWTLSRAARARLDTLKAGPMDRNRLLQVARSAADVDACRRMDVEHIETAALLTREQRRYGRG